MDIGNSLNRKERMTRGACKFKKEKKTIDWVNIGVNIIDYPGA
jgi:hypothetical protein